MRPIVLLLTVGWLVIGIDVAMADEKPSIGGLGALRQARHEAAHRRRRMIFNNDGDDVLYTKKAPTAEALLALRTAPLLGSQVDSIFYSNSLCFGHALHQSRVMEPFLCTQYIFKDNGLPQLLDRGIDPIRVMVDFGHRHGIEVFWDMRMNDTHDAMIGGYGPYLRPQLKLDHPEYLVGKADRPPKHGTWSSVNYALPEIRELAYRIFEEVCQKYDVDGVELDFLRHPCFFKSVADGGRATREELEMMTVLVRRIRQMTEREGLRRGRPILVAIRVPDSVPYSQGLGLDLERWLAEGLADMLIGSCYFQCNPWEYLVELGHRHGLPVYPCLSESRVLGETRFFRQSIESYCARAARAWDAGADGIYIFNMFDPRAALWRELGDPAGLRSKDKLYFLTVRNGDPERYLAGGRADRHVPVLTPSDPWPVSPDKDREMDLIVADDLANARLAGWKPQATCHVRTIGPGVELSLNGRVIEKPAAKGDWLDFAVAPALLQKGVNRLTVRALRRPEPPVSTDEWTLVWNSSQLPGPPWTKMGFAQNCAAELRDGALLLADRGQTPGSYAYFQNRCTIRPEDRVVIEARVKLLSGWSSVIVENGAVGEEIQVFPDRVKTRYSGLSCRMSTIDVFHTYRIVICRQDLTVYVDGQLRIDAAGRFTYPAPNGRSGVAFGGANSPSLGEALWKSVKLENPTASLLDVVLSIQYPGVQDGGRR